MILKSIIIQAVLAAACLVTTGLCEEAVDNPVAWLRGAHSHDSVRASELDALNHTLNGIKEAVSIEENAKMAEKRDPKRRPGNNNKNNSTNQDDDDSGAGKADISVRLSIGAGLIIMAMFL